MMKAIVLFLLLMIACTTNTSKTIQNLSEEANRMKLSSPAFKDGESIPPIHTCDGENKIIPLIISGVPKNTASLALVIDDPDAPVGIWDHWILWNIPPETKEINSELKVPHGKNSWGKLNYGGPCPPDKEHTYQFKIYALDIKLDLPEGSTKAQLEKAMNGHIIEQALLKGRYERK